MLMDINKLEWSDYMLSEFGGIKKSSLPEIKVSSSDDYGEVVSIECIKGVPITG